MGIPYLFDAVRQYATARTDLQGAHFVVDGEGFLHCFTKNWICGGDYAYAALQITRWCRRITEQGAKLEFIFDGTHLATNDRREKDRACHAVHAACPNQIAGGQLTVSEFPNVEHVDHILPPLLRLQALNVLKALQIQFQISDFAADMLIVNKAKASEAVVVSDNVDLVIMAQIAAVDFAQLSELIAWDAPMPLCVLERGLLAREWNIPEGAWPTFATFCGNEHVDLDDPGYQAFLVEELGIEPMPAELPGRFDAVAAWMQMVQEPPLEVFYGYLSPQCEAQIEASLPEAYNIKEKAASLRPAGSEEWQDLVLHILLRRHAFLPPMVWSGGLTYTSVWGPSAALRIALCAMLHPGESLLEGFPQSINEYKWLPVNPNKQVECVPAAITSSYSALQLNPEKQQELLVHLLSNGEPEQVASIMKLFQSKKLKKRQDLLLPVLTVRHFVVGCAEGPPELAAQNDVCLIGAMLALMMLPAEEDRSAYLLEVLGMDPMQIQMNTVAADFLAAYHGTVFCTAMLNDVCGKPLECDPRVMYDGQWLHTLLSGMDLCLTERPEGKKRANVLELKFPAKVAETTMLIFDAIMESLPETTQQNLHGDYVGQPPDGRFRPRKAAEKVSEKEKDGKKDKKAKKEKKEKKDKTFFSSDNPFDAA